MNIQLPPWLERRPSGARNARFSLQSQHTLGSCERDSPSGGAAAAAAAGAAGAAGAARVSRVARSLCGDSHSCSHIYTGIVHRDVVFGGPASVAPSRGIRSAVWSRAPPRGQCRRRHRRRAAEYAAVVSRRSAVVVVVAVAAAAVVGRAVSASIVIAADRSS